MYRKTRTIETNVKSIVQCSHTNFNKWIAPKVYAEICQQKHLCFTRNFGHILLIEHHLLKLYSRTINIIHVFQLF